MSAIDIKKLLDAPAPESLDTKKKYSGMTEREELAYYRKELNIETLNDGQSRVLTSNPQVFVNRNFFSMFIYNFSKWVVTNEPTVTQTKVLFYLLDKMKYFNFVKISGNTISKDLGLSQSQVSEAIKFLETTGFMETVGKHEITAAKSSGRWFLISKDFVWRGAVKDIEDAPKNYKIGRRLEDLEKRKTLSDCLRKCQDSLDHN